MTPSPFFANKKMIPLLLKYRFCIFLTQGDSEFIGRALSRPIVKMACEPYEKPFFPPALEWFQVFRGEEKAGELLAAFELLQVRNGHNIR